MKILNDRNESICEKCKNEKIHNYVKIRKKNNEISKFILYGNKKATIDDGFGNERYRKK